MLALDVVPLFSDSHFIPGVRFGTAPDDDGVGDRVSLLIPPLLFALARSGDRPAHCVDQLGLRCDRNPPPAIPGRLLAVDFVY